MIKYYLTLGLYPFFYIYFDWLSNNDNKILIPEKQTGNYNKISLKKLSP